ncbi:MAG: M12 family metallo-peptidase [Gammaproteobacteria bacterium]|nr:M12 family metallo-peptidase [Gammaproteobacteria bacterium]
MSRLSALLSILIFIMPYAAKAADGGLWQPLAVEARASGMEQGRNGLAYRLDTTQMSQRLANAEPEGQASSEQVIELPVNGKLQSFRLEESPIMAPGLATRYPDIKTYKVQGVDNPYASGRLSMTPKGFHGMITSPSGTYYIDPQGGTNYVAYKRELQNPDQPFSCGVAGHRHATPVAGFAARTSPRVPGSLQVYRLAVAATAEYVAEVGPSVDEAQAEIAIAINRVNQIYERDLAIRLQLIDNNQWLSYTDAATDPYSNNDALTMLDENQTNIDSVIGGNRYDIGHVFATGAGGIAWVGAACNPQVKAQGVTGLSNPTGDAFYIDYVAHEIGHQLGADHSFNGTTGGCSGNRWQPSAFEPGSGSSIMSYAGICGVENIQSNTDALFHAGSIAQIDNYTGIVGCDDRLTVTNNPSQPVANAGANYIIPLATPFALTGTASDADGDSLSYTWDQMDAGLATNGLSHGSDLGNNALFRSRLPQTQAERHFPQIDTQLSGFADDAEVLPTMDRTLNFRFSVRDGKSGIAWDDMTISTDPSAGPFAVTSHASAQSLDAASPQTVTWSVAGTNAGNVNCSAVDIDLLMFNAGSSSYCESSLASSVSNNGSAGITLPDENIPNARFRVSCANNIFYALSTADLEIINGSSDADTSCQPVVPAVEEHEAENIAVRSSSGSSGGGLFDGYSLMLLLALAIARRSGRSGSRSGLTV